MTRDERALQRLVSALPPETAGVDAEDRALIERSVDAVLARRLARQSSRPSHIRLRPWMLLAAVFLICGAAAAMALRGRRPPTALPAVGGEPAPTPAAASARAPNAPLAAPTASEADIPTFDVSSLPSAPKSPAFVPTANPTAAAPTAAELFTRANEARRQRDMTQASGLYLDLQKRHPRSPEAILSRVTLGRIYLDSGRAAEALPQFSSYLAEGKTELREEAMIGRASALEALGRRDEEKRAWRELLDAYPSCLAAPRARERLEAVP